MALCPPLGTPLHLATPYNFRQVTEYQREAMQLDTSTIYRYDDRPPTKRRLEANAMAPVDDMLYLRTV